MTSQQLAESNSRTGKAGYHDKVRPPSPYKHIQTIAAPAPQPGRREPQGPVFTHQSLQSEVDANQLRAGSRAASKVRDPGDKGPTFAGVVSAAVMAAPARQPTEPPRAPKRRLGGVTAAFIQNLAKQEAALGGHAAASAPAPAAAEAPTFGPPKINNPKPKRSKKWLNADHLLADDNTPIPVSPPAQASAASVANSVGPEPESTSSHSPVLKTPTQATFGLDYSPVQDSTLQHEELTPSAAAETAFAPPHSEPGHEDLQQIMDRISSSFVRQEDQNMARLDDPFDTEDWDPDLPSTRNPAHDSPEQMTIPPEPLSYTTVGSLVKSNDTPHFTAPVRIQREGAGRRPPLPMISSRGQDMPALLRASALQAHQQVNPLFAAPSSSQSTASYDSESTAAPKPYSDMVQHQDQVLRSLEDSKLQYNEHHDKMLRSLGVSIPQQRNPNVPSPASNAPIRPPGLPINEPAAHETYLGNFAQSSQMSQVDQAVQAKKENNTGSVNPQGALASMGNFQTIQRLAAYENPNQAHAKNMLAEYSANRVSKLHDAGRQAFGGAVERPYQHMGVMNQHRGKDMITTLDGSEADGSNTGSLDLGFSMPTSRGSRSENSAPNPLYLPQANTTGMRASEITHSSYLTSSGQFNRSQAQTQTQAPIQNRLLPSRPGVPQPLMAGPPGQRQRGSAGSRPDLTRLHSWGPSGSSTAGSLQFSAVPSAPGARAQTQDAAWPKSPAPAPRFAAESNIIDTLPPNRVTQYYLNGFPTDMTGRWKPVNTLPHPTLPGSQNVPGASFDRTADSNESKFRGWFYGGVRNADKTIDDHIQDMEERQNARLSGVLYEPKQPMDQGSSPPLTMEQLNAMTTEQCIEPLMSSLFGTLLAYTEQGDGPDNRRGLSRFTPAPAWAVDKSEEGNKSFFGEDWGPAPKRLARDSRYQPGFHNPSSTLWEAEERTQQGRHGFQHRALERRY